MKLTVIGGTGLIGSQVAGAAARAADHHQRAHCPAMRRTYSAQASREGSRTRSA